eukprot:CAMPEP_0117689074 /NCGR_PEP_ID=MMETSP0804-20121206/24245_1 /TAXON_ID=1074897 /ORGANISM="Tetraselmis astigmatica, Strain CCMP880" /LENGTH=184 /DNA_ID=CAMNT_0005501721 /DNA_START=109 /DNA_END=664 /DNA_ORIENTATION=+
MASSVLVAGRLPDGLRAPSGRARERANRRQGGAALGASNASWPKMGPPCVRPRVLWLATEQAGPPMRGAWGATTADEARAQLNQVEGWEMYEDSKGRLRLKRQWKMRNFPAGLEMFHMMGEVAEDMKHHPDLHLEGWNKVTVEIWSHETGGLTEADFQLASKLAALPVQDLLWKPKKKKVTDSA